MVHNKDKDKTGKHRPGTKGSVQEPRGIEFTMGSVKHIDMKTGKCPFTIVIQGVRTIKQKCTGEYENQSNKFLIN